MKVYKILGHRGRVTIPQAIRESIGFCGGDVVSFDELDDGQSVVIRKEFVCDGCGDIDVIDVEFDDDNESSDMSLITDLLDGLSPEEQRSALVHLSMRIANKK